MLPDLDPSSWEDYQKFVKGDEEVDSILADMLAATEANYDKAQSINEESQKQNELSNQLHSSVKEALDTSHQANDMADEVMADMDATPWFKYGCYVFNVLVILACGYYIYTSKFS